MWRECLSPLRFAQGQALSTFAPLSVNSARGLARRAERSFAALRMTARTPLTGSLLSKWLGRQQIFGDNACHPERSEGSGSTGGEILRCAQDDSRALRMTARTPLTGSLLSKWLGRQAVPCSFGGTVLHCDWLENS